jgi:hypothetical protein
MSDISAWFQRNNVSLLFTVGQFDHAMIENASTTCVGNGYCIEWCALHPSRRRQALSRNQIGVRDSTLVSQPSFGFVGGRIAKHC